jgi:hypothetical protein
MVDISEDNVIYMKNRKGPSQFFSKSQKAILQYKDLGYTKKSKENF